MTQFPDLTVRTITLASAPAQQEGSLLWHAERAAAAYTDATIMADALEHGSVLPPRVGDEWWRPEYASIRAAARWVGQHPRHPAVHLAGWTLPTLRYYALGDVVVTTYGRERKFTVAGLEGAGPQPLLTDHVDGPSTADFLAHGLIAVGLGEPSSGQPVIQVAFFPWATLPILN